MKAFFRELLEYNNYFNQQLIVVMNDKTDQLSEKCIRLQSHILNVHQIWNRKLSPEPNPFGSWDLHQPGELAAIDERNFSNSILLLDQHELEQNIEYSNSKGQVFNNKFWDILFQIINHSTYHRAQIATEFRQCGIEPLLTDYIYYKWVPPASKTS